MIIYISDEGAIAYELDNVEEGLDLIEIEYNEDLINYYFLNEVKIINDLTDDDLQIFIEEIFSEKF